MEMKNNCEKVNNQSTIFANFVPAKVKRKE